MRALVEVSTSSDSGRYDDCGTPLNRLKVSSPASSDLARTSVMTSLRRVLAACYIAEIILTLDTK